MFERTLFVLAAAALTTGTLVVGASLHAAPVTEYAKVSFADLDLSRRNHVAQLERRVERAADKLCRVGERGVGTQQYSAVCKADVLTATAPALDRAVASARTGRVEVAALYLSR